MMRAAPMRRGPWLAATCAAYLILAWPQRRLVQATVRPREQPVFLTTGDRLEAPEQWNGTDGEAGAYQKVLPRRDGFLVTYGFRNFDRRDLAVAALMPRGDVEASMEEFGFREADLAEVEAWYRRAREGALALARSRLSFGKELARRELDRALSALAQEYRERRVLLYARAGFRLKAAHVVEADVPALVRRNARRMDPAALAFSRVARASDYGMEELVGAVAAMAQTALRYEVPATRSGEKVIGGVLPPPKSFVVGQGDCDTKSALIGSILLHWPGVRLVGLEIPGHYLLAVHRFPARGEVYIEHEGLPYVMIEASGPAWIPPGQIGEITEQYLASGRLFGIQKF